MRRAIGGAVRASAVGAKEAASVIFCDQDGLWIVALRPMPTGFVPKLKSPAGARACCSAIMSGCNSKRQTGQGPAGYVSAHVHWPQVLTPLHKSGWRGTQGISSEKFSKGSSWKSTRPN